MCGIAGFVSKDRSMNVGRGLIADMCAAIRHRGPDDTGIWAEGNVGFGMTRLSIIDLEGGHQPIHNEDKTVWIVFNGEIYNYPELRASLLKRGHVFYTSSDTETIVHLYEEYGRECVSHLRGMFAFAIWDKKRDELFIARDRLGIKPLYYYLDEGRLIFGSEIKSILRCGIPTGVHYPSLVDYFFYGYVPDPDSMFEGVRKLPPGHSLTYKGGKAETRQYWDVKYEVGEPGTEEFYVDRLLEILDEAVRIHLISDVPLGAFLSGGIDSSVVAALMSRHMKEPVKTFSIGFKSQKFNELPYARMVAEKYNTEHHEEIVEPDAKAVIEDLVRQFDEPFADSSAIPTYYVSRMARKHVKVVLTGDGGDELFGGYTHYLTSPITRHTSWIPEVIKKGLFLNMSRVLPEWSPGINTLRHISCSESERFVKKYSRGMSLLHGEIFSEELGKKAGSTDPSPALLRHLDKVRGRDPVTKLQYLDTKMYLPSDILTKVDRMSMMVSLEARVPILDHRLVEFAATIPPELKVRGMDTKYIFKKAAERLLPKEVIHRPKQGFAVPINEWIKGEWAGMSEDLLLGQRALSRNNFNPKFLGRIMNEHRWGRRDHSHIIWTLMVLELWFREMIDGKPARASSYADR